VKKKINETMVKEVGGVSLEVRYVGKQMRGATFLSMAKARKKALSREALSKRSTSRQRGNNKPELNLIINTSSGSLTCSWMCNLQKTSMYP
jgi:hypothetical protein